MEGRSWPRPLHGVRGRIHGVARELAARSPAVHRTYDGLADRHCRYFHRLLTPAALLYTEMHSRAILHGDRARHLAFDESEHPVALQLGGSEPAELSPRRDRRPLRL